MIDLNDFIVLGIVFLAVLVGVAVFLPIFTAQKKKSENNDLIESYDDPVRRFVEPEMLQKMRYSAAMIVVVLGVAFVIAVDHFLIAPLVIVFAFLAYQLPQWMIMRKIKKRNKDFDEGMLDFAILIANSLRVGIAFPSAIEMAIETVGGTIREEFMIVLREHRLGMDLIESLDRLAHRIDSENFQLFSATVCVTMRTGGSMADVLDHVISTIRQRSAFQDKLKTMIAQSEFEALCISLAPLAAFVVLYVINNELMKPMVTTVIGWVSICGVIVLETVGFIILKAVTKVKF